MSEKQYLLTCMSKRVQKGTIIARHCGTDNLEKAKENYMDIIKNVVGIKIEGSFRENFKIIHKCLVDL